MVGGAAPMKGLGWTLGDTEIWTPAESRDRQVVGEDDFPGASGPWGRKVAEEKAMQIRGFKFLVQPKEGSGPFILIWAPDPKTSQ